MLPFVVHRPVVGYVAGKQNIDISKTRCATKKSNDIFEINVKNTFRGTYCNHRLNFAHDQCYRLQTFLSEGHIL